MNLTAIWSAVAASFSALTAFLVMLVQRRNLIETVRPDLIPVDWERIIRQAGEESIVFKGVRNFGRGAAFNVNITGEEETKVKAPIVWLPPIRLPAIASNQLHELVGNVLVFWDNVPEENNMKQFHLKIYINYQDGRGVLYKTIFSLWVIMNAPNIGITSVGLAPHMYWLDRKTTSKPKWRIKMVDRSRQEKVRLGIYLQRIRNWVPKWRASQ